MCTCPLVALLGEYAFQTFCSNIMAHGIGKQLLAAKFDKKYLMLQIMM